MNEPSENSLKSEATVQKVVEDYIAKLTDEHRMLVVLKSQLYGGSWEPMLEDLNNRLADKPYIFKLVNRINDDIERIQEMKNFEDKHDIDLSNYIELQ